MIAISTVNVRFVLFLLLSWSLISSADATLNLEDKLGQLTQNYVITRQFLFHNNFELKSIAFSSNESDAI